MLSISHAKLLLTLLFTLQMKRTNLNRKHCDKSVFHRQTLLQTSFVSNQAQPKRPEWLRGGERYEEKTSEIHLPRNGSILHRARNSFVLKCKSFTRTLSSSVLF